MQELEKIGDEIWHAQHHFRVFGASASSRMTVVRLEGGKLLLHSPIPITDSIHANLQNLGTVSWIIAPSKTHHLFAADCQKRYPESSLFGAPGLAEKLPDLAGIICLDGNDQLWAPDLEYLVFMGIPLGNETVWFHQPTRTLILTDLCQWWQGPIAWHSAVLNRLMGVRKSMDVPRSVRLLVKDKEAARASARKILEWPIKTVVLGHNSVIKNNAKAQLEKSFSRF